MLNRCLHAMRRETAAEALTEPGRSTTPAAPATKLANRSAPHGPGHRFLTKSRVFPMLSVGMLPGRDGGACHHDRSGK
jgi:hypothetical protein